MACGAWVRRAAPAGLLLTAVVTWLYALQQINTVQLIPQYAVPKTYITTKWNDGRRLGNLMFSYASMLGIGVTNNMTAVLEAHFPLFSIFQLTRTVRSPQLENTLGMHVKYHQVRSGTYDVHTETLQDKNTFLVGFFQSWKYFRRIEALIKTEFKFREKISSKAANFFSDHIKLANGSCKYVAVHVRRGDMVRNSTLKLGYTVADKQYFNNAMQYFRDRFGCVRFVVATDDVAWCSAHLLPAADVVFASSDSWWGSPELDMAILTMCNHTIMSTGTFSWWVAFLTNGTTIYYDKWPRQSTRMSYEYTKTDYFYPHWIPMH